MISKILFTRNIVLNICRVYTYVANERSCGGGAYSQSFRIAYFVRAVKTRVPRDNGNVAHAGGSPLMFAVQRMWNPDMVRV